MPRLPATCCCDSPAAFLAEAILVPIPDVVSLCVIQLASLSSISSILLNHDRNEKHRKYPRSYLTGSPRSPKGRFAAFPLPPPALRLRKQPRAVAPYPGPGSSAASFAPAALRKRRFSRGPPYAPLHAACSCRHRAVVPPSRMPAWSHAAFRSALYPQPFQLRRSPLRSERAFRTAAPLPRQQREAGHSRSLLPARNASHSDAGGRIHRSPGRTDASTTALSPRPWTGNRSSWTVLPRTSCPHKTPAASLAAPKRYSPARWAVRLRRLVPHTAPPHIRG